MKTCPFCKESVQPGASICPHCRKKQPSFTNLISSIIGVSLLVGLFLGGFRYWFYRTVDVPHAKQMSQAEHLDGLRAKDSPQIRKQFAKNAEDLFLDHSFDAQFIASGKDQRMLTVRVPYFSRVDVHAIGKKLDWEMIKALGFRKVIYTDGEHSISWDVP